MAHVLFPPPASCFTCGHAVVQYVVHAVAVFELGFFVFSFFDQLQYGSTVTDATVGANNTAAALVQAQRDTYLAALSVFTLGCVELAWIPVLGRERACRWRRA